MHPRHMDIPKLGVKLELQQLAYITAHSNTRSLTHRVRPGVKPMSSWIIVGFITAKPQWELRGCVHFLMNSPAICF